jgi:hypothetical protein
MAKATRDIGASVRARLLNLARQRGQVLDLLLTRYALERLLYRLSLSAHRNRFVLKYATEARALVQPSGPQVDQEPHEG